MKTIKILESLNEISLEFLALKSDPLLKDTDIKRIDRCAEILEEVLISVKELDSFINPKCSCSRCLSHDLGYPVKSVEDYYKEEED